MTLIKSISGIRGTIGGMPGNNLTPADIVKFTSGYGHWIKNVSQNPSVVVGRDARISGKMVSNLVTATLQGMGINVIDLGLSTTPTVEMAVTREQATGGIILTASHNPEEWNALKLLNSKGEFISGEIGHEILKYAENTGTEFASVDNLGSYSKDLDHFNYHIEQVLACDLVDAGLIRQANFKVAIDCVNSTGGIVIPLLLDKLGVQSVQKLFCEPSGHFPHNPEPLPENLTEISDYIKSGDFDLGIVVDPDVDRLAFVNNDGTFFGEEYTLVAIADYILENRKGVAVSNLSSTRALRDVCKKHGVQYEASAVGEVNVVDKMKENGAVIGGEGNGGVIFPELHYGRDALIGIGLFLTHLAKKGMSMTSLRDAYPSYHISKNKMELTPEIDVDELLLKIKDKYSDSEINDIDGIKVDFEEGWLHLRKSNTEPIIRIYSESKTKEQADRLATDVITAINEIIFSKA